MNAVSDTSAMISLAITGLEEKACEIIENHVPSEVRTELLELNKYDDAEGHAAERILQLISSGAIRQVSVKNQKRVESLITADVQHGEAACLVLCIETGIVLLIMDDVDAAYALAGIAHAHDITMRISVAVVVELFKQRQINRQQLKMHVATLVKSRRWEGGILEVLAKKYLDAL